MNYLSQFMVDHAGTVQYCHACVRLCNVREVYIFGEWTQYLSFGTCYMVSKYLSLSTCYMLSELVFLAYIKPLNYRVLSHLSDFVKCRRRINFRSLGSLS